MLKYQIEVKAPTSSLSGSGLVIARRLASALCCPPPCRVSATSAYPRGHMGPSYNTHDDDISSYSLSGGAYIYNTNGGGGNDGDDGRRCNGDDGDEEGRGSNGDNSLGVFVVLAAAVGLGLLANPVSVSELLAGAEVPAVLAARIAQGGGVGASPDPMAGPSLTEVLAYGGVALLAAKRRGKVIGLMSKLMFSGARV